MNSFNLWLCILLLCLISKSKGASDDEVETENISIDSEDITVEYKLDGREKLMEAYKSIVNDRIITNKIANEYSRLAWYSLGSPMLANIPSSKYALFFANVFEMTSFGFNVYVDILNDDQKENLRKKIQKKYGIEVNRSQIYKLKPSTLTCYIEIQCENDMSLLVNGSLSSFTDYPLKVNFRAVGSTKTCFENYLIDNQHLDIDCIITRNSKRTKDNISIMTTEQMNNSNVILSKRFKLEFKDGKLKYQHLKNQMVENKKPLKSIKIKKYIKHITECLEECENFPKCHYVQLDQNECYFYDQNAYFHLVPLTNQTVRPYLRRIYSKKELPGYKLSNYFKNFLDIDDSDQCWEICLKNKDCVAVSYNYSNSDCFLFKKVERFVIDFDDDFVSISYENENFSFSTRQVKEYNDTQLVGSYFDRINKTTIYSCWSKCLEFTGCVAISFFDSTCYLYNKSSYSVKINAWISIAFEDEKLNKVDILEYTKTHIYGYFRTLNSESKQLCFDECLKYQECIAISYGEERCHLIKKGEYQSGRYDNWDTICLKNDCPIKNTTSSSHFTKKRTLNIDSAAHSLALLQNGDLASSHFNGKINIWDVQTGSLKYTLTGHTGIVCSLVTLHNGNLISGAHDKTIKIWESNKLVKTMTGHSGVIFPLAVFPNTDFASGSHDSGSIIIWSMSGDKKRTINVNSGVMSLVVLQNGDLASGLFNGQIKIWSSDGNLKQTLDMHGNAGTVWVLGVLHNGFLVSGHRLNNLKMWNLENGQLVHNYVHNDGGWIAALAILPNGDLVFSGERGDNILLKRKDQLEETITIHSGHTAGIRAIVAFSNGDFACAGYDNSNSIWSYNEKRLS